MKLLVISSAFPPMGCGEASNTYFLCRNLVANDLDIHLLTTDRDGMPEIPGVTIHGIMRKWSWSELRRLLRFVIELSPDTILLMYLGGIYNYHPMVTFLPTFVKRVLPQTRFVTRFENVLSGWNPRTAGVRARIVRKVLAKRLGADRVDYVNGTLTSDSTSIVVLCDYHRELLQQRRKLREGKVTVIPPAANVRVVSDEDGQLRSEGRKRWRFRDDHFVIGYMGYVYPNKGVDTLLRSFSLLVKRQKNARLLIAGGRIEVELPGHATYYDDMLQLARDLDLDDHIEWTGSFSPDSEDVPMLIHAADVWALPLDNGVHLNNSSFATLAGYGMPIIVTRGSAPEAPFVHGDNVFLCQPKSPTALANALETVLSDSALICQLRRGVRRLSDEWFSWPRVLDRTKDVLQGTQRE